MSQQGILSDVTTPLPDLETLTGNTGGKVGPDTNGNINVIGGTNLTITGNAMTHTLTADLNSTINGNFIFTGGSFAINSGTNNIFIGDDNGNKSLRFGTANGSGNVTVSIGNFTGTSQLQLAYGSNGAQLFSAFATAIDADVNGIITTAAQPSFSAFLSSTQSNVTGDGTIYQIIFDAVDFNQGVNPGYNDSTGIFTAPSAGIYEFFAQCSMTGITTLTSSVFNIVTSNRIFTTQPSLTTGSNTVFQLFCRIFLSASDTASVTIQTVDAGGKINDVFGNATTAYTYFTGRKCD